jgi:hypothetical protein
MNTDPALIAMDKCDPQHERSSLETEATFFSGRKLE